MHVQACTNAPQLLRKLACIGCGYVKPPKGHVLGPNASMSRDACPCLKITLIQVEQHTEDVAEVSFMFASPSPLQIWYSSAIITLLLLH